MARPLRQNGSERRNGCHPAVKRVSFKTVGCRLNQAETASLVARFQNQGYRVVPFGQPCEVAVVHSCAVTRRAERDSVRAARAAKRLVPPPLVILAGCAAAVDPKGIREESGADRVLSQAEKWSLPHILDGAPSPPRDAPDPIPHFETTRALLKAQDGCDFCCAYCIVPRARGKPVSRAIATIVAEAERLADRGFREMVLTGVNLGRYSDGRRGLVNLIEAIERLPGIVRIRLSSIEPTTAERAIIDHMAGSAKLCRQLHLPLQSGDDRILAAMGRRYDARAYRATVEYAVRKIPRLGLGTDVLVGFPDEDEAAFDNTRRLVHDLPFSNLHVFPYSRRPATRAAGMPRNVGNSVKKERCGVMLRLGEEKRAAFARSLIGREVSVLVERLSRQGTGTGWTSEYCEAQVSHHGIRLNDIVTFVPRSLVNGVLI